MKKAKIAFYGINGTGLGHLSRLLNVAREGRELLHAIGVGADFRFLSTSEAPQTAWDFPVWKMPSKTVVAAGDTDNREYLSTSQFLVTNVVAVMRPDVLVMDTVPQGSFGEFVQLRAFSRRTAFINRHKGEVQAADPLHQSHLPLYDLVLTPDAAANAARYPFPDGVAGRNVFTGVIHGFRREEALSREQVRARFGAEPGQTVIYLSAGGGGDRHAAAELDALISELSRDPAHFLLVGYGPLFRGEKRYARNVVPLADADVRNLFPGVDLAFSAAGYNGYEELLAAGVPTAFYAQVKGMDRQDERVALGVGRGWHLRLEEFDGESVRAAVEELKSPAAREGIARALAGRGEAEGALVAAVELLRLHAGLPHSGIDERLLLAAAALRAVWPEVAQARSIPPAESRRRYVRAARRVLHWYALLPSGVERNAFLDGALAALARRDARDRYRAAALAGLDLELRAEHLGIPEKRLERIARAFLDANRHAGGLDDAETARRLTEALDAEARDAEQEA